VGPGNYAWVLESVQRIDRIPFKGPAWLVLTALGHQVFVANFRGPASLADLALDSGFNNPHAAPE